MIKFVLMLQLCVSGMCYPPLTSEEFIFDTYKECTITGYEECLMNVVNMDDEYVKLRRRDACGNINFAAPLFS